MNSRNLHYVLAVAEERNFSRAAKRLYIAQPSLSQCISSIEAELGVKIFDRSTVPLTLTYAGERFIDAAKEILHIEERLQHELEDIVGDIRGRVTIGLSSLWGERLLPRIFPAMKEAFPAIELALIEDTSDRLREAVIEGKADLIVSNSIQPHPNLKRIKVHEDDVLLAAPRDLHDDPDNQNDVPLATPRDLHDDPDGQDNSRRSGTYPAIDLMELRDEPFLLLTPEQGLRRSADEIFAAYGLKPTILLETRNVATALKLAAGGIGCTFILESLVNMVQPSTELAYFQLSKGPFKHPMYIYYRKDMYLSRPILRMIELIRSSFPEL